MKLDKIIIRNFRLLRRFSIDLAAEKSTTVLVGANNSGKTSVMEALRAFTSEDSKSKAFCVHDLAAARRSDFARIQKRMDRAENDEDRQEILRRRAPRIRMDLHFSHGEEHADLVVAQSLLMNLEPKDNHVALRIEYGIDNAKLLLGDFKVRRNPEETLFEFVTDKLPKYYGVTFRKISTDGKEFELLKDSGLIHRLIKVDMISAQRHIDD